MRVAKRQDFQYHSGIAMSVRNLDFLEPGLRSTIKSHPHLLSLIDSIKLEQSNTENQYIKLSCSRLF